MISGLHRLFHINCLLKYSILTILIISLNVSFYLIFISSDCIAPVEPDNQFASSVFMKREEREIIRSYLKPTYKMLEYGSGYSTLYFSQFVHSYYSIEHDRRWYETMRKLIEKSPSVLLKLKKYLLFPVETGYKGWLGGYNEGNREQFEEYIRGVHRCGVSKFDVVLIDGRARVECAKEILPHLHRNSIVFVHDYTQRLHYYNISKDNYRFILNTYGDLSLVAFKRIR